MPRCDLKPSLKYTQSPLDRSDGLRRSPELIENLWRSENCLVVPVFQNQNLFDSSHNPLFILRSVLDEKEINFSDATFLGLQDKVPYFSCICTESHAKRCCELSQGSAFVDLRKIGPSLNASFASILAYARGISFWHSNNQYCAKCGGKNEPASAGHMRKCTLCDAEIFPRTDPAVIMLVEHIDKQGRPQCLLGRSPAWPQGCYSTLAGFVETGESIETAVVREVFEETGIVVSDPVYVTSQPWPFPQSVMLGFVAKANNTTLLIDRHEIADAAWFSADQIQSFGEWADDSNGYKLPRTDSIARYLIDSWVAQVQSS